MYELRTAHLEAEVKQLKDRLAQNSRNSNKPPSSDVFNKPAPKRLRKKTGRKPGSPEGTHTPGVKSIFRPPKSNFIADVMKI